MEKMVVMAILSLLERGGGNEKVGSRVMVLWRVNVSLSEWYNVAEHS